ncbi:hypothetical protein FHW88_004927 [Mucilaginibacter sp. SG538B]|uniref:hypothetical protein n=1 Tax=Mucilaginibacter sp. SG538B TaxID=2587021 RepID=UPI00159E72A4|nr:hypothetical protein [Mucilaginibacter sp. SG538B]NVM66609.1 hypothetical protein [Mucilaginibacter sp. SG538B]
MGQAKSFTEKKSKLGHLEVISSPLVKKLCSNFEDAIYTDQQSKTNWQSLPEPGKPLSIIFSSSSAYKAIESLKPPHKAIAFVKSALLRLDQYAIAKLDQRNPSPFAIRDLMKDSALFHSTAFPLRHVFIPGKSLLDSIREIIFESVKDPGLNNSLSGDMMKTLKWIAYEKWSEDQQKGLTPFGCPHCAENVATLAYDQEKGECPNCKNEILITDIFGLHFNITQDDYAPNQVATDYMAVCETLMIFSPIRYFWENNKANLNSSLMIKEGPLSLRATLSKLKAPIQRFFRFAKKSGYEVAMVGYEKSGVFYDHFNLIAESAPDGSIFIPDSEYIKNEVFHTNTNSVYGEYTNYGAKVFIKFDSFHKLLINVPTGEKYENVLSPSIDKLIAIDKIVATLPQILSNKYEGALLPMELVDGIASLSTYPSAKALDLFSQQNKDS